jgi:hypothetical protein
MTKQHINGLVLSLAGLLFLLMNKPFSELCRQWEIMMFHRDHGILSFRVPVIIIAALFLILGLGLFFS